MKIEISAAFALLTATSLHAQTGSAAQPTAPAQAMSSSPAIDLNVASPISGDWVYAQSAGGSQATFQDSAARPQLTLQCTRATRQVTITRPAAAAAPLLSVWTTAQTRNLPASFNPATASLTATLPAFDPLLDAMAFSRGRIGFTVPGQPPLVVPPWEEVARVIEDCRV